MIERGKRGFGFIIRRFGLEEEEELNFQRMTSRKGRGHLNGQSEALEQRKAHVLRVLVFIRVLMCDIIIITDSDLLSIIRLRSEADIFSLLVYLGLS